MAKIVNNRQQEKIGERHAVAGKKDLPVKRGLDHTESVDGARFGGPAFFLVNGKSLKRTGDPLYNDPPNDRRIQIGVDDADPLFHPRRAAGICGDKWRPLERGIDVPADSACLVEAEIVVLKGWYSTERMPLGKGVRTEAQGDKLVPDPFLLACQPDCSDIGALRKTENRGVLHRVGSCRFPARAGRSHGKGGTALIRAIPPSGA